MPPTRRRVPIYENQGEADSQCWFPPLELQAWVAAGVLRPNDHRTVLDVGCGLGTEAIFLARMGWNGAVYAIDTDDEVIEIARKRASDFRVNVKFKQCDFAQRRGLPEEWPTRYSVVLDRFFINNFGDERQLSEREARADYFERMSEIVEPGGLLVVRDRLGEIANKTFRRVIFSAMKSSDFLDDDRDEAFEPLGPIVRARLAGDDTSDSSRLDAMIPIPGILAILRRRDGRRRVQRHRR